MGRPPGANRPSLCPRPVARGRRRARLPALARLLDAAHWTAEATDILRSLIEAIAFVPSDGELKIELHGDLAGILNVATKEKGPSSTDGLVLQVEMVAGTRYPLFRNRRPWVRGSPAV